jgi:DNA-binding NarL/FixJ family response regulator
VLIADDQTGARRSLNALLTAMRWSAPHLPEQAAGPRASVIEIVGEAENGQDAFELASALRPDVLVMDLHPHAFAAPVPGLDRLATIEMIKNALPATRIVVLTMYATDRASVLNAGADAFLLKGCPTSELLEEIMRPGPANPD